MVPGQDGTTAAVTGEEEGEVVGVVVTILGTTTRRHLTPARTTAASPGAQEEAVHSEETTHNKAGGRISGVLPEEQQLEQRPRMVLGGWVGTTTTHGTTGAPGAAEVEARRDPGRQGRAAVLA